jgi:hypothetical protein
MIRRCRGMQTSYELPGCDRISGQDPQPEARLSDPSVQSDSSIAIPSEVKTQSAPLPGGEVRLVRCRPDELHLHTSCARHKLTVPAWKLSAIENLGHFAFRVPLAITRDRTILDGHARWELCPHNSQARLRTTGPMWLQDNIDWFSIPFVRSESKPTWPPWTPINPR